MKRVLDLLISLFLFFLLIPLGVVVSIWIKLDSKGAVFYTQSRIGEFGKVFKMIKFRTMVSNADKIGGYSTKKDDQRITKSGKFLRKYSLDELPQLINVILGHMSLVGPRPDVPQQKSMYSEDDWNRRCMVKPGVTGLAQSTKRSSATPEERLCLDLQYVENKSILLDLKIIYMTIKQVFTQGSY